jgi:tripartite-type tricarboxylate transporter receptor subunit TctC
MFADSPSALPHIKTGRLRPLGISSPLRSPLVPDLPTIAESGVAGYESNSWVGLVAPKGTPPDVISTFNTKLVKSLASPDVKSKLQDIGGVPMPGKPEQFGSHISAETRKWARIIKEANIPLID